MDFEACEAFRTAIDRDDEPECARCGPLAEEHAEEHTPADALGDPAPPSRRPPHPRTPRPRPQGLLSRRSVRRSGQAERLVRVAVFLAGALAAVFVALADFTAFAGLAFFGAAVSRPAWLG